MRRRRWAAGVLVVVAAVGGAGCARAVDGTPVAAPGAVGAGANLLATTCREYAAMTESARREVIAAIGADGNALVNSNPDLWTGVAVALCTFADPGAPVADVLTGGIR